MIYLGPMLYNGNSKLDKDYYFKCMRNEYQWKLTEVMLFIYTNRIRSGARKVNQKKKLSLLSKYSVGISFY